ncbi:hypothetical protein GPX89_29400 [Nocardia sp. ET3-3]|uniref:LA2681-like HEPN domain-containing protein n=1 Tax=Nocardia terrae TaxID=2675851 RepID=A0A7K1V409_9NOCA|nr:LA2681 family HEPN domain-containing protein [Nocardia terrae]MVU81346.1 hypothetical protein [Nocardia terrae]
MDRDKLRAVEGLTIFLDGKIDEDATKALVIMTAIVLDAFGDSPQPTTLEEAAILMNAAGVLINAGVRASDIEALGSGEEWMTRIVKSGLLIDTRFESAAIYNLANSRLAIAEFEIDPVQGDARDSSHTVTYAQQRFDARERLRLARIELDSAAALADGGRDRGMRLCNLANTLDHSGRWIEAYDAYVRALKADPENGNAAGNAAVLISRAIGAGWDFEGHLCSLYDHYLAMAKANRAGTVAVAGEPAAQRFDEMDLLGTDHPVHDPIMSADPYGQWIIRHRLALVAALEGLGSNGHTGRWDTIGLRSAAAPAPAARPLVIFRILNVLKADYLVARRLAFEADQLVEQDGGRTQHSEDPGVYTDTLDQAVHGEVSAKLVLAHRAALDVLDKTAVAVNEHLQIGDDPRKVWFRRFWFEDKNCTQLRASLISNERLIMPVLAMAELAIDMAEGSLYGHAQDVRNAGTHRFVFVHLGMQDIPTTATMRAMTLDAMRETCHQALTVARAAFLYLVALLDVFEASKATTDEPEDSASRPMPSA